MIKIILADRIDNPIELKCLRKIIYGLTVSILTKNCIGM